MNETSSSEPTPEGSAGPFATLGQKSQANTEPPPQASDVGTLLCATRMRLGKDLQDIAAVLHIRYNFLVAIEDGRYEDLPGQAYAIGFVRAYADHLGLAGDEVVRRYKEETAGIKRVTRYEYPIPARESGIPSGALLMIAVVMGMVVYGVWYSMADADKRAADVIQEVPDRLAALLNNDAAAPPAPVSETQVADMPPSAEEETELAAPVIEDDEPVAPVPTPVASSKPVVPTPVAKAPVEKPVPAPTIVAALPPPAPMPEPAAVKVTPPPTQAVVTAPVPAAPQTVAQPPPTAPVKVAEKAPEKPAVTPTPALVPAAVPAQPPPQVAKPTPPPVSAPVVAANTAPAAPTSQPAVAPPAAAKPAAVTPPPAVVAASAPPVVTPATSVPKPAAPATPPTAAPPKPATQTASAAGRGAVELRAKSDSWIQVRDGEQLLLTRFLRKGESYKVPDRAGLTLMTLNAGGVEIMVDGQLMPSLGEAGSVARGVALDPAKLKAMPKPPSAPGPAPAVPPDAGN